MKLTNSQAYFILENLQIIKDNLHLRIGLSLESPACILVLSHDDLIIYQELGEFYLIENHNDFTFTKGDLAFCQQILSQDILDQRSTFIVDSLIDIMTFKSKEN
jgi:hypothetical protein